ncbi:MAG: hypothetical protein KIT10_05360 [Flavobacteriales bacterium]|nr:hypothetical protein [Flavobacteriales bacterium]
MRPVPALLLLATMFSLPAAAWSREYVVPVKDVAGFFATLPEDATAVIFSEAAEYRCDADIVLPARRLLVIDGRGARLVLGPNSNGFTVRIGDQKEAMKRTASRYLIQDFGAIEGGRKGVDLRASLGSIVRNCRFMAQTEVAVDLSFCLMCRVENVLVTNPAKRGIVLRTGDWPGATATNSQSNSTVLEQCRVYCASTTTQAFTVLNSGGVRMRDCISEGSACDHDLFLSAAGGGEDRTANNPVVKSFTLENFHVEHRVRKASIHVNMPMQSSVTLSNVYWNGKMEAPVIEYLRGQLNLVDIGWFSGAFRIRTRVSSPRINVDRCHSALRIDEKEASSTRAGVLELADPLPGNEKLSLSHVRVMRPSR